MVDLLTVSGCIALGDRAFALDGSAHFCHFGCMVDEDWKLVPNTENRYEVSTLGRVRNAETGAMISPYWQGKYLAFTIHASGRRRVTRLHRAVLEAFRGLAPDKVGAHLDGDPSNCRLSNLMWATAAENEAHKVLHGSDNRGEKSPHARFSNRQTEIIRSAYAKGLTIVDLAQLTNVNPSTIHRIVDGRRYHS